MRLLPTSGANTLKLLNQLSSIKQPFINFADASKSLRTNETDAGLKKEAPSSNGEFSKVANEG